jgi:hypothetical protein
MEVWWPAAEHWMCVLHRDPTASDGLSGVYVGLSDLDAIARDLLRRWDAGGGSLEPMMEHLMEASGRGVHQGVTDALVRCGLLEAIGEANRRHGARAGWFRLFLLRPASDYPVTHSSGSVSNLLFGWREHVTNRARDFFRDLLLSLDVVSLVETDVLKYLKMPGPDHDSIFVLEERDLLQLFSRFSGATGRSNEGRLTTAHGIANSSWPIAIALRRLWAAWAAWADSVGESEAHIHESAHVISAQLGRRWFGAFLLGQGFSQGGGRGFAVLKSDSFFRRRWKEWEGFEDRVMVTDVCGRTMSSGQYPALRNVAREMYTWSITASEWRNWRGSVDFGVLGFAAVAVANDHALEKIALGGDFADAVVGSFVCGFSEDHVLYMHAVMRASVPNQELLVRLFRGRSGPEQTLARRGVMAWKYRYFNGRGPLKTRARREKARKFDDLCRWFGF